MLLFATIIPPAPVRKHLVDFLDTALDNVAVAPAPRGLLRRRRAQEPAGRPLSEVLTPLPLEALHLPIGALGNLTTSDSMKLADALRGDVATWTRPELQFNGGIARETPDDDHLWVKLAGDIDELWEIARQLPNSVQRLGYMLDRRSFRPLMPIGTLTGEPREEELGRLIEAMDVYRGLPWIIDRISLMKRTSPAVDGFVEWQSLPLDILDKADGDDA